MNASDRRPPPFHRARVCACGCLWMIAAIATAMPAKADDRVVLQRGTLSGRIAVSGTVEDYTGAGIAVRLPSGELKTYPAAEVVEVQTPQIEPHARGVRLLAEGALEP